MIGITITLPNHLAVPMQRDETIKTTRNIKEFLIAAGHVPPQMDNLTLSFAGVDMANNLTLGQLNIPDRAAIHLRILDDSGSSSSDSSSSGSSSFNDSDSATSGTTASR